MGQDLLERVAYHDVKVSYSGGRKAFIRGEYPLKTLLNVCQAGGNVTSIRPCFNERPGCPIWYGGKWNMDEIETIYGDGEYRDGEDPQGDDPTEGMLDFSDVIIESGGDLRGNTKNGS